MIDIPRAEIIEAQNLFESLRDIKHIHYRDLHPEIDETNYQTCTKVDFKAVQSPYDNIKEGWNRLKLEFKYQITSEYESHARSGSKYFTTTDGNVYRLSNHWGCVKTCIWSREGKGNFIASFMMSGAWEIGVANLSEFVVIRQKTDWKKDFILNPVWIEKVRHLKPQVETLGELKRSEEFKNLPGEDKGLIGGNYHKFGKQLQNFK